MIKSLIATAALIFTVGQASAQINPSLSDATAFFWDGSAMNGSGIYSTGGWRIDDYSTRGGYIQDRDRDPCIIDITQQVGVTEGRSPQFIFKKTRINFRKMPEAAAFTISQSNPINYRSFKFEAEVRLPDGAMCELGKDACWTSWRIWDSRGEVFVRRRLQALDYIRNTFCKASAI
jgi:hypothetical protein